MASLARCAAGADRAPDHPGVAMEQTRASAEPPLGGLYRFVREHLAVANAVVLASGTLVAVLDFIAPRLSILSQLVYCGTAAILAAMVLAAAAPRLAARALAAAGLAFRRADGSPLWRRPAWQAGVAILAAVTVAGFASLARADQGGLIASRFPELRSMQVSMLGLRDDMREVAGEVRQANAKLDALVADSRDPQRELVARGYRWDDVGFSMAMKQGDRRAVALFAHAGYCVRNDGPMANILNGDQPWDGELVGLIPREAFANKSACDTSLLVYELKAPSTERVRAFARLCDTREIVAQLERMVREDAGKTFSNDWHARQAAARRLNLSTLKAAI
jgi:hypothetical protein